MRDWGRLLIRSFGVLHLAYGAIGSIVLVPGLLQILHGNVRFGRHLYERPAYYIAITINCLFVGALIMAGLWLVRLSRRGVTLSNFVLGGEILYWLASSGLSLGLALHGGPAAAIGQSMGAVAGMGDMATSVQVLTGYPLIALVALNFAR